MPTPPAVLIVMCTYNGARWLPAQLASIAAQEGVDWALVVSDDGSSDGTCDIVRAFAKDHPVTLYEAGREDHGLAPSQRAARNYMQTLTRPDLPLGAQTYVALTDQDDVWRADKLAHALTVLQTSDDPVALYGGQSRHITEDGTPLAHSRPPRRGASLHNALVQNVVSGHSAVLSPAAAALVRRAGIPKEIWYHDWWIYLLVAATGGAVLVDDHIGLEYRQHDANVIGAARGRSARLWRLRQIFNGEYGRWLRANFAALTATQDRLTPKARAALTALDQTPISMKALWRAQAYRQNPLETFCIFLAACLGKL